MGGTSLTSPRSDHSRPTFALLRAADRLYTGLAWMIQTVCKIGKLIRCTTRHWQSIVQKHDALAGLEEAVVDTLQHPRYIG